MVKIKIKWLVQYQDQGEVGGAAIVYGTVWRRQPGGSKGLRSSPGGLALHCFYHNEDEGGCRHVYTLLEKCVFCSILDKLFYSLNISDFKILVQMFKQ